MDTFTVYILYSPTIDKFYIGYTSNIEQRLHFHNDSDKNKIWTKRGQPWEVFFTIQGLHKSQALKIEKYIKRMKSKKHIQELPNNPKSVEELKVKFR
ncbi:MAG: excinuclease ABC subunit C [Cytophagales bacterium CG12_big_fil_rev_8_21_14_0_65_40_12]|nr:MAG: excinuclease ABC subunit C [Cytophagales bacterium CG12_big_fil_rev_8_21_14_0_65_40_12]PIW06170.1 MAG: excinuclease ABC subunit C [Cytophagales bacterium CG17_big_fil_post_rev_8_21_14_2_50_40_13]